MEVNAEAVKIFEDLITILDNAKTLEIPRSVPKEQMTPLQKKALHSLSQHFECLVDQERRDSEGQTSGKRQRSDDDTEAVQKRRRAGPRDRNDGAGEKQSAPENPWRRVMKLDSLCLAPTIERYLTTYGTDPTAFLADNAVLKRITEHADDNLGDALLECYRYTAHLESRQEKDSFRWCFSMLMIADLVATIRPGGSGRVGEVMLPKVLERLNVQANDAKVKLNQWSRCGVKLDMFCTEFGYGCLFFLKDIVSRDFLLNKCTSSGAYHDAAFEHLRMLGLKKMVADSPADELGRRIRDLLRRPFKKISVNQGAEARSGSSG